MANYELIGLDEATPRLLAPTANDTGTIVGSLSVAKDISDARGRLQDQRNPLAKAIRVALAGSASVRGPQALDDADLDMGTNDFTLVVQKRITTTRPAADEILLHKWDGTNGLILRLLTTGFLRLTINGFTYDSTAALASATNVEPVIMVPTVRETATTAGSVTFVVDGVQLGNALAIAVGAEKVTNGTFDSDITGWTLAGGSGGSMSWEAGKLRIVRSATTGVYQAITFAAGETRNFKATCTHISGGSCVPSLALKDTTTATDVGATVLVSAVLAAGASGDLSISYTSPSAQTLYLHVRPTIANGTYDFDNITSIPSTYSVDNASNLFLLGTSTTTTEGDYLDGGLYNRALSVAECLAYCVRGPALADVAQGSALPSPTPKYSSNFSAGVDGWTGPANNTYSAPATINSSSDWLEVTKATGGSSVFNLRRPNTLTLGKRYRHQVTIYNQPASGIRYFRMYSSAIADIPEGTEATVVFDSIVTGSNNDLVSVVSAGGSALNVPNGTKFWIKNSVVTQIGLVAHWPAFNAQTNTGQLADRSGNKNHLLLPASGATIIGDRRPQVQITWENTWSVTSEMQYIPGVNQAVYPAQLYLDGIVVTPSASTTAGFTIGNGSNASYYGTVSGPLTAGVPVFVPLNNRYSDGTNLKLTITPMATTTSTLAITVFGRLLGGF